MTQVRHGHLSVSVERFQCIVKQLGRRANDRIGRLDGPVDEPAGISLTGEVRVVGSHG